VLTQKQITQCLVTLLGCSVFWYSLLFILGSS